MKTIVVICIAIVCGTMIVKGQGNPKGTICYHCVKQSPIIEVPLDSLIVKRRPQCEILFSANQAEIKQHTTTCKLGCVKIEGEVTTRDGPGFEIQIRDCLDPGNMPFQNYYDASALIPANYTCPAMQRVDISPFEIFEILNITMRMCQCYTDFCNFDPFTPPAAIIKGPEYLYEEVD